MPLPTEDRRPPRPQPTPVVRFATAPRSGRRSTLGPSTSSLRLDSSPPSLRHAPDSPWQRFMFWLLAPAPQEAAPPLNRLPRVREDFMFAVADLPGEPAHALRHRILHAHSLRDLWHLRAEVFSLVSVEHAQSEAEQRLLRLNRHFPMRATRSQFGSLGGL
jgi:hypothetical protein